VLEGELAMGAEGADSFMPQPAPLLSCPTVEEAWLWQKIQRNFYPKSTKSFG